MEEGSEAGLNSALDLFTIPPTDTSILKGHWQDHEPEQKDSEPIEFTIPKSVNYIDLSKTQLYFKIKVIKKDGKDLKSSTADDKLVAPINNILHSLIQQFSIKLNGIDVTEKTDSYAYKAYLESLLNYNSEAKSSFLTSALFYKDTAGQMDETNPAEVKKNKGLKDRFSFSSNSKEIELIGTPFCDIFHTDKFLLPQVEMKMSITLNPQDFVLMSESTASGEQIVIVESKLRIRYVQVMPSVALQIEDTLERSLAKYALKPSLIRTKNIQIGTSDSTFSNIFNGLVPERLIVGITTNKAKNGDYKKNPFNFGLFKMTDFSLTVDGNNVPHRSIELDKGNLYGYNTLFAGDGTMHRGRGNGISRVDWGKGYGLFIIDLTPDGSGSAQHLHIERSGIVNLKVKFSAATTEVLTMFVYGEFQRILEITKERNILYNFYT